MLLKDEFAECIRKNTFGISRTLEDLEKIGKVEVTIHHAKNLPNADKITLGKSDPYCFVNLGRTRFRTCTIERNLNPVWERTFYFDIEDLYHNLVITLFDQDQSGEDDFLGRICLPVQDIIDGKKDRIFFIFRNEQLFVYL